MKFFQLIAKGSSFNGTDRDSSDIEFVVLRSQSKEKLEEIIKLICPDGWGIDEDTPYGKACKEWFRSHWGYSEKDTFPLETSFGIVQLPYLPDSYYGAGSISSLDIEAHELITPDDFI